MTSSAYASFSNHAVASAAIVYLLAFLSHVAEWALARKPPADEPVP